MTCSQYNRIESWFRHRPAALKLLKILNHTLPMVFYLPYPLALLWLLWHRDSRLALCVAVPAIAFLGCTAVRHVLNRPRPYEVWNIRPLIQKNKSGHSFPSRHLTCAGVIAVTFCYLCPPAGAVLLFLTALMAAVRVIAGIHFTKDVTAGALIGLTIGFAGFFIL